MKTLSIKSLFKLAEVSKEQHFISAEYNASLKKWRPVVLDRKTIELDTDNTNEYKVFYSEKDYDWPTGKEAKLEMSKIISDAKSIVKVMSN